MDSILSSNKVDFDFMDDSTVLDLINNNNQDNSRSITMDQTMPMQMGEDVITSYPDEIEVIDLSDDSDSPTLNQNGSSKSEDVDSVQTTKEIANLHRNGRKHKSNHVQPSSVRPKVAKLENVLSMPSSSNAVKSCNHTVTSGDLGFYNQNLNVTTFDKTINGQGKEFQRLINNSTDSFVEISPDGFKMTKEENALLMFRSLNNNINCNHTVTTGALSSPNQSPTSTTFDQNIGQDRPNESQNVSNVIDWAVASINEEPQMYYQLLDLFPEIDRNYLSDLCKSEFDITVVTDIILASNNNYPKHPYLPSSGSVCDSSILENICTITSADSSTETKSIEQNDDLEKSTRLQFLMEIFPKADPDFLKEKCTLNRKDLKVFITEAMEKHDYPKIIEQTVSKQEDMELYTTSFNLNNFLKVFPDPFAYFMDEKRICQNRILALEFIKARYKYQSLKVIKKKYADFGYNLSRTCEFLESAKRSRSTKRSEKILGISETENLPLLQEVCFINHKKEIKAHLDGIAESKKLAYEKAEARGELVECGCCFSSVIFEDCGTCNEGDLFCKSCILKSTEVRIGDGHTTFPCLSDCGSHFSLNLLQNLLETRAFSKLLQRIQLDEVRAAEIEGLEMCPFCEFATIPPPETNIFTCLNPECLRESCRKCHKDSHIPLRCNEVEDDEQTRARKYIEDEMTKALVRECYKCKKSFIKSDGCNKMTCSCGAKMCYFCRKPLTKDYKHLPGQHIDCPGYSTDKSLHVDPVKAAAEKALQDVAVNNPELKLLHDPSKILPDASDSMIEGVHFYQNLNPAVVLNPDMVLNPGVVMAGMRRMHEASLALPVHVNQVEPIRSMRLQEVHRRTVNSPRQFQVRPVQWFNHIVQLNPSDRDRAEFVHLFANPQPRVPEDIPEPNVGNPPNQ